MELDDFKVMLQTRNAMPVQNRTHQELESIIKKKSRSVIKRMQYSLVKEMAFAVTFMIFIIVMIINLHSGYTRIFCEGLLAYSMVAVYYMAGLYRQIGLTYNSLTPMYIKVKQVIRIIEKFVRLYYQVTMVFIPATLLLGFASGWLDHPASGEMPWNRISVPLVIYYAGASACWYVLMYFFTKRYIHKLYGGHLQFLRTQLKTLEELL